MQIATSKLDGHFGNHFTSATVEARQDITGSSSFALGFRAAMLIEFAAVLGIVACFYLR
jgi:hypothetical protein